MTSIELKERLLKAEEKATKCGNTIERHKKQLEKKQAKLLRVDWMAQYMDNLNAVMWDEEKRSDQHIRKLQEMIFTGIAVTFRVKRRTLKELRENLKIRRKWLITGERS